MQRAKYFNLKRFMHLLKREAHINIRRNLLIIGAMYSLFTITMFLVFEFGEHDFRQEVLDNFHFVTFTVMLFLGGVFITSFSFIELRDKMKSHFYLLTPGSAFEKFAVNIFISCVAYVIVMFILYITYSYLFNWISFELYDLNFNQLLLSGSDLLTAVKVFVLVHSIFFLGAVTFKKYPVILTPIAGFLFLVILSLANKIGERVIFNNIEFEKHMANIGFNEFFGQYEFIAEISLFIILPLILWFVAYLKLNEKEY